MHHHATLFQPVLAQTAAFATRRPYLCTGLLTLPGTVVILLALAFLQLWSVERFTSLQGIHLAALSIVASMAGCHERLWQVSGHMQALLLAACMGHVAIAVTAW